MIKYGKVRKLNLNDFNIIDTYPKAQIQLLKEELSKTDYQAIKFAEGEISEEEFAPIKEQRKLWRQKINELEAKL